MAKGAKYQRYPEGNEKWQLLQRFFFFGCGPSWSVYFETLLPAIGAALLMLVSTSTTDVARAVFRPKHPGYHHKRRGRKGKRGGAGFPQTEEIIGEFIGGEGLVDAEHYNAGTKNLWRFDAAAQELFFYFLIADVVDEFYYAWISGIIARGPSNCGDLVHMSRRGSAPMSGPFDGFIPLTLATLESENGVLSSSQGVHLPPGRYQCVLSGKVTNNGGFGHPAQYQVRFFAPEGGDDPYVYSQRVQLYPGEFATLIAQAVIYTESGTHWEMGKFPISGIGSEGDFQNFEMRIQEIGVEAFPYSSGHQT